MSPIRLNAVTQNTPAPTTAMNRNDFFKKANARIVTYGYDPQGRLNKAGFVHGGQNKEFTFTRLVNTNLLQSITCPNNIKKTYEYEEHRELVTSIAATLGTDAYNYSYDNIGNRKTAQELARETTYDANQLNQYASIAENDEEPFVPTCDGDGNQTKIKTKTGIWTVAYNALNRPVHFTRTAEDGTVTTITADYDFMGRRVYKKVETTSADPETGEPVSTVTSHQRYLYRGYLQIAALDLMRSTLNAFWYILWDPTEPVATRPLAIQTAGSWFTYGLDLTKNVTELYKSDGTIANAYAYEPFGGVTQTGNITNPLQWSSEVYDAELGMVYYNFRFYHPRDGRWTSRDPIGEDDEINMYGFVGNTSIASIDYLGQAESEFSHEVSLRVEPHGTYSPLSQVRNVIKQSKKYAKGNIKTILEAYSFLENAGRAANTAGLPSGNQIRVVVSFSCKCDDGCFGFFKSEKELKSYQFTIHAKDVPEYDGQHHFDFLGPASNPEKFHAALEKLIETRLQGVIESREQECISFCKDK